MAPQATIGRTPSVVEEELDEAVRPYRWTVESFFRAVDRGAFENPEHLELLDGEVIERVTAQGIPHFAAIRLVANILPEVLPSPCEVRQQGRWTLSVRDYVEPDVLFARGTFRDYLDRDPNPDEVLLVVEVSDTTLRYDRTRKAPKYAMIGVSEYWILNLAMRQLEVYRDPAPMPESRYGFGYRSVTTYGEVDGVIPEHSTGGAIRVGDLLPPA